MSEGVLDFQTIHADFRPKIQRYLTRLVGVYEAEDLTQEVLIRISQSLHTFRGESKLSTWVYRIATNAALDRLRAPSFKRTIQNELSDVSHASERACAEQDVLTGGALASLEQQLFRKERSECYRDYIENLPLNYRMVVALSEFEELAANEIAEILGLSLDVVKIRLHRGRARLLQELKAHCKAEDWL
ncbi:MAG: sigma-70 family RNA polymerase sigma factor [Chloroflexi bacterium]|nr:sigma-70 family RNA polymerase sigma factor [Chloroflexota bacterium]